MLVHTLYYLVLPEVSHHPTKYLSSEKTLKKHGGIIQTKCWYRQRRYTLRYCLGPVSTTVQLWVHPAGLLCAHQSTRQSSGGSRGGQLHDNLDHLDFSSTKIRDHLDFSSTTWSHQQAGLTPYHQVCWCLLNLWDCILLGDWPIHEL